jgi:threonyl-tRNA synthetase
MWDRAESALQAALQAHRHEYERKPGDRPFYRPKIDIEVEDAIARIEVTVSGDDS